MSLQVVSFLLGVFLSLLFIFFQSIFEMPFQSTDFLLCTFLYFMNLYNYHLTKALQNNNCIVSFPPTRLYFGYYSEFSTFSTMPSKEQALRKCRLTKWSCLVCWPKAKAEGLSRIWREYRELIVSMWQIQIIEVLYYRKMFKEFPRKTNHLNK